MAQEGRADGRRVPAQLAVHVPVDGEARGVLRNDATRPEGARDRPRPLQEPARQREVRVHVGAVQPCLRLGRDRRRDRVPALHEAVRRRGVARIRDVAELHRAYDQSGEMLMHLQAAVDGFDVFARALTIGAETMVMRFDPDAPMHERYRVEHEFLDAAVGDEVVTISRTVNAFFRWEFNSCEVLVKDGEVYPIDYANACPDVSLISLHYYFPWAMQAMVKWVVFCLVTGRRQRIDLDTQAYFDIGDRDDLSYEEKLATCRRLADAYFSADAYREFCDARLPDIGQRLLDWVSGPAFDALLTGTVRSTYPAHEQDRFIAHFRGLVELWVHDQAGPVRQ